MAAKPRRSKAEDEAPTQAASIRSGGVNLEADRGSIGGDVVGRDKIVNSIRHIYERALTAAEVAERAQTLEAKVLAQGVSTFAQRLQARASDTRGAETGSPYKGLLEYRLSDAEIFFGRAKAIRDVLGCLQRGPLTVLQSESGAGKTSLLQAGLSPQLIAAGHLPLYLRPYNVEPSYVIKRAFISDPSLTPALATAPLRDFLGQACGVLGLKTTLYLFLDQFEEFFTQLDDPARDEFVRELAECLDDESLNVRWLLALRAEYFGNLANFRPRIRNPFENDYRLNRLTRAEAVQVITEPVAQRGVGFEPGLVDALLDDLGRTEIAPPQVQLVCSALFDSLDGQTQITGALYQREGGAAGILRGYLEQVLSRNLRREDRAAARWILESLISSEQQRIIRNHAELADELSRRGVTPQTLDTILTQLVDSRLLRAEETDEGIAYELAHDYLLEEIEIDPEVQARKAAQELLEQETRAYRRHKTLLTDERLKVIEPYRDELSFTPEAELLFTESRKAVEKERAARERRRNALLIGAVTIAVVMALLGAFGLNRSEEAGRQAATAKAASTLAVQQAATAQAASTLAVEQRDEAQRLGEIAFSRQLAAQAQSVSHLDEAFDLALLLAAESGRVADTFEARSILLTVQQRKPGLIGFGHGHSDWVWSVAFSPDGKTLASGSSDGTVILWDVATRQALGEPLTSHSFWVTSVAFSPDGERLASVSGDGALILWDVATRQALGEPLTGFGWVNSVAFSPDGKTLASGSSDGTVILWDMATRQALGEPLAGHSDSVLRVTFSPDGETLASGSEDGEVIVWDVATRRALGEPLTGNTSTVRSVAFSPDGETLASGSGDGTVILWDVATGQVLSEPLTGHTSTVRSVAFSPDGARLASGSGDGTVIVWDVATRQALSEPLTGHSGTVNSVAFSPDGERLASGMGSGSDYGTVILWDVSTLPNTSVATRQALGEPLAGHSDSVRGVAFSPDGKTLASGSRDATVILWDVATRRALGEPLAGHSGLVRAVAFSPDGKTLASGSDDRTVILWDVATRQALGLPLAGHSGWVNSVAFSPGGKTLASGSSDGTVILWDMATRQALGEPLAGHSDSVLRVTFSPDGETLASGSEDGEVIVWDVATRQALDEPLAVPPSYVESAALSPDGGMLASGSEDGTVNLWDVSALLNTFVGGPQAPGATLARHTDSVRSVAFSPDGKTLASGSEDGTVILWDVTTGQALGEPLAGHSDGVWSVAFSPDGETLASDSDDGTLILWDVDRESWIARACSMAGRNFTQLEWARYFGERGEPYRKTCEQWPAGE